MSYRTRILLDNEEPERYRLFINGIEYKLKSNWAFTEQVGNSTSSTCTVLVENQPVPQAGDLIEYMNDTDILFLGICGIPKSPKFSTGNEAREYQLTCNNANSILSRRIVNESFANKTITEIVENLFENYISAEGFTKGVISEIETPEFEIYNAKNMNLQEVLNELANYVEGAWICTADRVFNFVIKEEFPLVVNLYKQNAILNNLQRTDSNKDLRTRQIIDGAFNTTDPQTEEYLITDNFMGFNTVFPIALQPTFYVDYGSTGTYTQVPSEFVGIKGVDSEDTTKLFLWAYDDNAVDLSRDYTGSFVFPVEGDQIKIVYQGLVAIRVVADNGQKQQEIAQRTGTSGIIDNVYTDKTITKRSDAENKATALLDTYGEQKVTITANTNTEMIKANGFSLSDFALYSMWRFNLPEIGIEGDYVITERKITPYILNDDTSAIISLKWVNRNFVQSYGETISRLYKDISKISVRAEERLIQSASVSEALNLAERVQADVVFRIYVTTGMNNGQIAEPLGSVYPWIGD